MIDEVGKIFVKIKQDDELGINKIKLKYVIIIVGIISFVYLIV